MDLSHHLVTSFVKIVESPNLKQEKETEPTEKGEVGKNQSGLEERRGGRYGRD